MLVPFSIDPEALACDSNDLSISIAAHRRVINEWRKHGILIHSSGSLSNSTIVGAINSLPQECRKLWKAALTHNRRLPSSKEWDGNFPSDNISRIQFLAHEFKLALLDATRAVAVAGVGIHESSKIDLNLNGMELCKFHAVNEAIVFSDAEKIAVEPLPIGVSTVAEWNKRYKDYLIQANQILVVDRYIFTNHIRRVRRGETSGLDRLLTCCFARQRDRAVNIKILCAAQDIEHSKLVKQPEEVNYFFESLSKRYSGGGIRGLECFILTDDEFRKHDHARYMRTDYSIFGVDSGLDVFGGNVSTSASVIWRLDMSNSLHFSQTEAALQMNSSIDRKLI